MEKPSIPKGTRDFGPAQMAKRQFILENIKKVFQKYGFQPLETPAMENLTTLTGKYGDEGDQLLFKVLDSGDYLKEARKLLEADPSENNIINTLLRDFSTRLLSILNEKQIEFLYKNTSNVKDEIIQLSNEYNFDATKYSKYLKEFIRDSAADLAYKIVVEPTQATKDLEPFEQLLRFVIRTNLVTAKIKEEFETKKVTPLISEKGLRYDLTVPFARYVVMNRGEISFPFKRYQIQPVWRADRPQKGRYREFYQCDADVVGTDSLICEAEIVLMIKEVLKALGIGDYSIKINHRRILSAIAEFLGAAEKENDLFVAIDKLEKLGKEKITEELLSKGFKIDSIHSLFEIINPQRSFQKKHDDLSSFIFMTSQGPKGIKDIIDVFDLLKSYGAGEDHVEFDIALARGLSYYTGCIFEVKINNVAIGSVSGGGRYDNLTGNFGMPDVSGVGISFGVDRLYDAMEELQLFPKETQISSTVMIAHFDDETMRYGLKVAHELRQNGIATEIYPDQTKLKKQLDYANKKMIPFVIVIGSDEIKDGQLTIKNMEKGEQEKLLLNQIIKKLAVGSKQ